MNIDDIRMSVYPQKFDFSKHNIHVGVARTENGFDGKTTVAAQHNSHLLERNLYHNLHRKNLQFVVVRVLHEVHFTEGTSSQ